MTALNEGLYEDNEKVSVYDRAICFEGGPFTRETGLVRDMFGTIRAIVPRYTDMGDCTIIYAEHVYILVRRRLPDVMMSLATELGTTPAAAAARARKVIGDVRSVPIALAPNLVLMPVHVRRARVRNDCTRAYLNVAGEFPLKLEDGADGVDAVIGHDHLPILMPEKALERQLILTKLLMYREEASALRALMHMKLQR